MLRSRRAGNDIASLGAWQPARHQALGARDVHVWRIRLDAARASELWVLLSPDEQERASRFHFAEHRHSFVVAHGMLRRLLARYAGVAPEALAFGAGDNGKPTLHASSGAGTLEFNLSHSGDYALLAVSRGGPVGVDIERWNDEIEHLELAEHFFSPAERDALHKLREVKQETVAGFFAAWSRKEAYLKARGDGIVNGLHHFDVSLLADEPARLIEDRTDASAPGRWMMVDLAPGDGYSAALVATLPVDEILLCDAD